MNMVGRVKADDPGSDMRGCARADVRATTGFFLFTRKTRRELGRRPARKRLRHLVGGSLTCIVVIAAVTVYFDAWSIAAARLLPEWLVEVFNRISDFGKSGWFLWPTGLLLIAIALASRRIANPFSCHVLAAIAVRLEFLFVAIVIPGLVTNVLKRLIGRARPFVGGEADPYLFSPFSWRVEYMSLPSGHATTAFSILVAVGALWPSLRPVLWVYAIAIAVSRVVLTSHHPSDVIVGAIVGGVGAILIRDIFAARRLVFAIDRQGRVRAMPGPSWRRIKRVARAIAGR